MNDQQKWNRYVRAINYCMGYGYFIKVFDSKGGNVKCIKVTNTRNNKETLLFLKPKKYGCDELLQMIYERIGM